MKTIHQKKEMKTYYFYYLNYCSYTASGHRLDKLEIAFSLTNIKSTIKIQDIHITCLVEGQINITVPAINISLGPPDNELNIELEKSNLGFSSVRILKTFLLAVAAFITKLRFHCLLN